MVAPPANNRNIESSQKSPSPQPLFPVTAFCTQYNMQHSMHHNVIAYVGTYLGIHT